MHGLAFREKDSVLRRKHYLLTGAGFSRNWGGWLASEAFEYLLGDAAVAPSAVLRSVLWKNQPVGGFEAALDEMRLSGRRDASQRPLVDALEAAVVRLFDAMNSGFGSLTFEFRQSIADRHPVQSFLSRFDAIFTLNQDLLLECHYMGNKESGPDFESWKNWQLPGMQLVPAPQGERAFRSAIGMWMPSGSHVIETDQPIFKLHGSSNWRTADANRMLILGGGKREAIARYPVLSWYFEEFARALSHPDSRLMIIGYGFRDEHINDILRAAIQKGLALFVIDPLGSDVAKARNSTAHPGMIYAKTQLEEDLQTSLIGASRRSLREIFGSDGIERAKVMRFFE